MQGDPEINKMDELMRKFGFPYAEDVTGGVPEEFGKTRAYYNMHRGSVDDPVIVVSGLDTDEPKTIKFLFNDSDIDSQFDYHVSSRNNSYKGTDEYVSKDLKYYMNVPTEAAGSPDEERRWSRNDFFHASIISKEDFKEKKSGAVNLSEIFTEKGFSFKLIEKNSFGNSYWYRYEFTTGDVEYYLTFEVRRAKSQEMGEIMLGRADFSAKGFGPGAPDVMLNPIDTIRVMKTVGEIIEKHKNEIDYLEIASSEKRIKSYKALIGRLLDFEMYKQGPNHIYLKRLGAPASKPKAPETKEKPSGWKTKEEPALAEEFIRKFIRSSLVK
jgi:hypothetical protein